MIFIRLILVDESIMIKQGKQSLLQSLLGHFALDASDIHKFCEGAFPFAALGQGGYFRFEVCYRSVTLQHCHIGYEVFPEIRVASGAYIIYLQLSDI